MDQDIRRYFTDIKVIRGAELNTDVRVQITDSKIVEPKKRNNKAL